MIQYPASTDDCANLLARLAGRKPGMILLIAALALQECNDKHAYPLLWRMAHEWAGESDESVFAEQTTTELFEDWLAHVRGMAP